MSKPVDKKILGNYFTNNVNMGNNRCVEVEMWKKG